MPSEMSLREHFSEMRSRILRVSVIILIIIVFCITFGFKVYSINLSIINISTTLYLPFIYPDPFNNLAIQITSFMKDSLLPLEVKLIQTAPGQAFFAQIYVAALLGIIVSIPLLTREIYEFILPAIEEKEKKRINFIKMVIYTVGLFIIGLIFSYSLVIPFTLEFLYKYGESIGVETFLNINDFITFVLQFLIAFGISFELPLIMYIISLSQIIDRDFWRKNLRYSIIIIVVFGAIITPDGSGVTMWLIAGPMIILYIIGIFLVEFKILKKQV
ncbi:MAG TPA: twin-arginine translocase subunit TatC [Nitrososphaeraceae archaeon]|nr:twin-arginine translocase subunit TatC [Nitrososphaeraceae archaeon]